MKRVATVITLAVIWVGVAWLAPPLGAIAIGVHFVCAWMDMGMNGSADAEFVPYNVAGAALAALGMTLGHPAA
jgi:hypothetical protein